MDEEQIWSGYFMAVVAGGNNPGNAIKNAALADAMLTEHARRWPNGRLSEERRYREREG